MDNLKVGDRVRFITNYDLKNLTYSGCALREGVITNVTGLFKHKYMVEFKVMQGERYVNACIIVHRRNIVRKLKNKGDDDGNKKTFKSLEN